MLFLNLFSHDKPKTHYEGVRFLKEHLYDIIDYLDSIHPADKRQCGKLKNIFLTLLE